MRTQDRLPPRRLSRMAALAAAIAILFVISFADSSSPSIVSSSVITFAAAGPSTLPTAVTDSSQECSQLKDLDSTINIKDLIGPNDLNPNEPDFGFSKEGYYFCGADAPAYLQCKCGISSVCSKQLDPWGRDMGKCGCCTTWIIVLFAIFAIVIAVVLVGGMYACMCHGTWLYDGFPLPLMPLLPQRSATIIAPASFPLPEQAFRPYRSTDFISSDDPAVIAGAIAAAALEPPSTADGMRRRRRRGAPQQQQSQQAAVQMATIPAPIIRSPNAAASPDGGAPPTAEDMAAAARTVAARHRANVTIHMAGGASPDHDVRRPLINGPNSGGNDSSVSSPPSSGGHPLSAAGIAAATAAAPTAARRGTAAASGASGGGGPAIPLNSATSSAGSGNATTNANALANAAAGRGGSYSPPNASSPIEGTAADSPTVAAPERGVAFTPRHSDDDAGPVGAHSGRAAAATVASGRGQPVSEEDDFENL